MHPEPFILAKACGSIHVHVRRLPGEPNANFRSRMKM